jgi:hypothetical protein
MKKEKREELRVLDVSLLIYGIIYRCLLLELFDKNGHNNNGISI